MLFFGVRDTAGGTGQQGGPGLDSGCHSLVSPKNLICKSGTRSVGLRASGYMRALVCASRSRPAASPRPARGQPLTGVSEAAGGAGRHLRQRLVSGCQALAGSKCLVRGTRGCRGHWGTHWPVTQSWPPMGRHEGSSQHAM